MTININPEHTVTTCLETSMITYIFAVTFSFQLKSHARVGILLIFHVETITHTFVKKKATTCICVALNLSI